MFQTFACCCGTPMGKSFQKKVNKCVGQVFLLPLLHQTHLAGNCRGLFLDAPFEDESLVKPFGCYINIYIIYIYWKTNINSNDLPCEAILWSKSFLCSVVAHCIFHSNITYQLIIIITSSGKDIFRFLPVVRVVVWALLLWIIIHIENQKNKKLKIS